MDIFAYIMIRYDSGSLALYNVNLVMQKLCPINDKVIHHEVVSSFYISKPLKCGLILLLLRTMMMMMTSDDNATKSRRHRHPLSLLIRATTG